MKYLPYFSNCRGTDSNIFLYQLLETNPSCSLVSQNRPSSSTSGTPGFGGS